MSESGEENTAHNSVGKKKIRWSKLAFTILGAIAIFIIGFNAGSSGRFQIGGFKSQQTNLPADLNMATVQQLYDSLRQNYDGRLDINQLMDGLKHGLAQASGDPYTDYFTPKEAKEFKDELNGTFQGIGARLGKDDDGNLVVISPIAGFPAEKAGLRSKDIIAAINEESTVNMSVDKAVSKIRGPKGTTVTLKIVRGTKPLTIKIVRDEIKIPSVTSEVKAGKIGYIRITEFSSETIDLAKKAADDLKKAGVKAVILDLRSNPGGELNSAVAVSSLWLKKDSTILTERRGNEVIQTYKADGNGTLQGLKTVVLINEGSASASEITAGALRDNNVATIFGVKSFGKGSVQQLVNFGDGSQLKVTIARWFTPKGKNIDKQGIEPDNKVERTENDIKANKDPQLDAAIVYLNK